MNDTKGSKDEGELARRMLRLNEALMSQGAALRGSLDIALEIATGFAQDVLDLAGRLPAEEQQEFADVVERARRMVGPDQRDRH
jgi:hypothetical protein